MNIIDYEADFYGWTQQQAQLLQNKQIEQIDWNHVAEEIKDMGRSEKRELGNRLEILIMHLLKWQFQPNLRSRSWQLTVKEQRFRLEKLLEENPSLKFSIEDVKKKIYSLAVISAEKETGLSCFPETCPYDLTEILSAGFFPEG
jgi:hypothetical protein